MEYRYRKNKKLRFKKKSLAILFLIIAIIIAFVFWFTNREGPYEKYYQSYSSPKHFERLTAIDETAKKYRLAYTGGIDSHGYGICSRA